MWEVDREEEFAPLKNADAPGASDCASTCRRALFAQHLRWLLKSGASVELPAEAETEAEAEAKAETVDHLANGHTCNGVLAHKFTRSILRTILLELYVLYDSNSTVLKSSNEAEEHYCKGS